MFPPETHTPDAPKTRSTRVRQAVIGKATARSLVRGQLRGRLSSQSVCASHRSRVSLPHPKPERLRSTLASALDDRVHERLRHAATVPGTDDIQTLEFQRLWALYRLRRAGPDTRYA